MSEDQMGKSDAESATPTMQPDEVALAEFLLEQPDDVALAMFFLSWDAASKSASKSGF